MDRDHDRQTNTDKAQTNTDKGLHSELTQRIIGLFYRIYDVLGFGFLESVYRNALAHELSMAGIQFQRAVPIDVWYDGIPVGHFRADFLVEGR